MGAANEIIEICRGIVTNNELKNWWAGNRLTKVSIRSQKFSTWAEGQVEVEKVEIQELETDSEVRNLVEVKQCNYKLG